jgi:hypothetical protein
MNKTVIVDIAVSLLALIVVGDMSLFMCRYLSNRFQTIEQLENAMGLRIKILALFLGACFVALLVAQILKDIT